MPMPELGTKEYEEMIEFMREDLRSGFALTKIIMTARKMIEAVGKDFDQEFQNWLERRKKNISWKELPPKPIVFKNLK